MDESPQFYRDDQEWTAFAQRLKLTPCPHCKLFGNLNRHGCLRGFDDSSPKQPTLRARRVFCSNRNARHGCGRTFSVWCADKIRRLSLTTGTLLRFLTLAFTGSILAAFHATISHLSDRTGYRVWERFILAQSKIRTALSGQYPPPNPPTASQRRPAQAQVLAHLQAAFPDANCPIAAFQHTLHTFFV